GMVLGLVVLAGATGWTAQAPLATVSVQSKTSGRQIPKDFVGFSLEVSTAGQGLERFAGGNSEARRAAYALGSAEAPNQVFFQYMRNLGAGILRLGGNSQDNTCWDPAAAPHPKLCQGTLSAADFRNYAEAVKASGWRLMVGLNLKQNSSQWAVNEVTQGLAKELEPGQVMALEIGNEPDLFDGAAGRAKNYSVTDLVKEFGAYAHAFQRNPVASRFGIAGPAACCAWRNARDLGMFIDGVGAHTLKLVTVHEYPATTCNGRKVRVEQLLAPELMAKFNQAALSWVAAAHQRKLPIALAETNSASCGGMPGVSNAFAATLWGLDWLYSGAEDGFTGVNFHISYRPGGSSYNAIDTFEHGGAYENVAEPLYYAMYLFAHSASGLHLLAAKTEATANVRAYATSRCASCAVNVVVINKDASASGRVRVHLDRRAGAAKLTLLKAPSLDSRASAVSYGGRQFDKSGHIATPRSTEVRPDAHGDYDFDLPHAAVGFLEVQ
ncbi:MAG TPA: hypothetical protein VFU27_05000, partial [Terriglobales bacterium]|nr:hypothetical protein [Terriglobales bacterium]